MYTCHKILKIKVRESLEKKDLIACCSVGKVARERRQPEDKQVHLSINVSRGRSSLMVLSMTSTRENLSSGSMPKAKVPGLG